MTQDIFSHWKGFALLGLLFLAALVWLAEAVGILWPIARTAGALLAFVWRLLFGRIGR